jgi:hypothetical protein
VEARSVNAFESEWETERSKVVARWIGIVVVAMVLEWQRRNGLIQMTRIQYTELVGAVALANLLHTLYLARVRTCPPLFKYVTTGLDVVFATATICWTGYTRSPFFYLYFLLLVSNSIRYGFGMSLFVATCVNVFYAAALSLAAPEEQQTAVLGGEGLKLLSFWGVALYGGGIAARMRRSAHVIASYEDTIADLKEEVRQLRAGDAANESS